MKLKRILSTVLAFGTLCSFAACNSSNKKETFGKDGYTDYETSEPCEGTVHERFVGSTDRKLLENGSSEYKIVIREDAGSTLLKAVGEFNALFSEATGIALPVVTDSGLRYEADSQYISFGKTELVEQAELSVDYEVLGPQGYEIVTKGASVFVAGEDYGVLYGVYDMLEVLIGYEMYTVEYYRIDKNLKEIILPQFSVREVPDFLYRKSPNGAFEASSQIADRMRVLNGTVYVEDVGTHTVFDKFFARETYGTAHPKWFNAGMDQLCYTAHGDEKEYEAMVAEMAERVKFFLAKDTEHDHIGITQEDNNAWCSCDSCKSVIAQNGNANSATQIKFVNDVAERVDEWLASDEAGEQKGRKITYIFFAYNASIAAPAEKNAEGKFVPTSEDVKCRDNVGVWIASITTDFTQSIYASANTEYKERVEGWAACTDQIMVWDYDCHFREYLVPYDSWNGMQSRLRFYYDLGAHYYWAQGEWNVTSHTGFGDVKSYVWSKLMWNVNEDVNALIDEFFAEVYRDAADVMQDAYWQLRTEMLRHRIEEKANGYCMADTTKYYKKQFLVNFVATIEQARGKIAKYADTDAEYYKLVTKYITKETVSPNYILLKRFADTYSSSELLEFIEKFTNDLSLAEINKSDEQTSISGFLTELKALI